MEGQKRRDWLANNRFVLWLGSSQMGFSKIRNLVQEMEYDSIAEGGRNWSPHLFPKPKENMETLILEHGVCLNDNGEGIKSFRKGSRIQGAVIAVYSDSGGIGRVLSFDSGIVTKLQMTDLDAVKKELFIETLEIAHTGLRLE